MDAQDFSRAARTHLDQEEKILRELLDCLDRERVALVALDGPTAARIAAEKDGIVAREQILAEARRALVHEAAAMLSSKSGGAAVDLSLGEIVERLRPPGGSQLLAQRTMVRNLAAEAQRRNAVNRQLCVHALSCIRGYLSLSGRVSSDTYGASGRIVQSGGAGTYARRF